MLLVAVFASAFSEKRVSAQLQRRCQHIDLTAKCSAAGFDCTTLCSGVWCSENPHNLHASQVGASTGGACASPLGGHPWVSMCIFWVKHRIQ